MKNINLDHINSGILKDDILKNLLQEFWYAPNDAFLRAPEVAIWQSFKKDIKQPLLNIGCGCGNMDKKLFDGYVKHIGLDNNRKGVELARKSGFYKKVVCAGAEKMPFKDKVFNAVISNSTFEHIEHDIAAVGEVARVLKRGGYFIFNTTSKVLLQEMRKNLTSRDLKVMNKRLSHFHYRDLSQWRRILTKHKLQIKKSFYYHPPKNISAWIKLYEIFTFIPYRRELWSYLRDSKISRFMPKKFLAFVWYLILKGRYLQSLTGKGTWIYIFVQKK